MKVPKTLSLAAALAAISIIATAQTPPDEEPASDVPLALTEQKELDPGEF